MTQFDWNFSRADFVRPLRSAAEIRTTNDFTAVHYPQNYEAEGMFGRVGAIAIIAVVSERTRESIGCLPRDLPSD